MQKVRLVWLATPHTTPAQARRGGDVKEAQVAQGGQGRKKRVLGDGEQPQGRFHGDLRACQDRGGEQPAGDRQGNEAAEPQAGDADAHVVFDQVLDAINQGDSRHKDHPGRHQAQCGRPTEAQPHGGPADDPAYERSGKRDEKQVERPPC
jgi:hypothetical protein